MKNNNWVYGEGKWGNWYSGEYEDGYDDREFAIEEGLEFSLNSNMDFVYIGQVQGDTVINREEIAVEDLLKTIEI